MNPHFYDHKKLDAKWQKEWQKSETYKTAQNAKKKKMYVLDMFPYPSGTGLHVGHPRGYVASDVYARMKRMQGYNVLHPMGYDSFGLPAEQYAIQHKVHPSKAVEVNVKTFEKQLSMIGLSYDWSRRVATSDPEFYKWTQWIFLKLYDSYYDTKKNKARPIKELVDSFAKNKEWKALSKTEKEKILMNYRLAYEGYSEVNWCPGLGTVLANDEIIDGKSERGGFPVEKKQMRQWFMRISAYADRLLLGLDKLDWSEHIKTIQRNWIGKSQGYEVSFKLKEVVNDVKNISIYTTRLDTLSGVTFMAISKDHPLAEPYKKQTKSWSNSEQDIKIKVGIKVENVSAIHPDTKKEIPVYVTNYILSSYGTGAVMGVPDMDERDFDFASVYQIPVKKVDFESAETIAKRIGAKKANRYKMRDAVFARQRYWGEPIPVTHDAEGNVIPLKPSDLPLNLPNVKSYEPIGTGESPLAGIKSWLKAGYETNTMPGWAGSSWYFLRYMDPKNRSAFASNSALNIWKQVDMYIGGAEHATGHLLYSRFWNKFLFDLGLIPMDEPFKAMRNQGMILATDGRKMSKSWGNVINPDECINTYGSDAFRLYEMFIGPFESSLPWSTDSIIGARRFVDRVWRLFDKVDMKNKTAENPKIISHIHKTIKKVTEDIDGFAFNTAVSSLMILLNELEPLEKINKKDFETFIKLIAPFTSHISEELWTKLGNKKSIHLSEWPVVDDKKILADMVTVGIQINGKLRGEVDISPDENEKSITKRAEEIVKTHLEDKEIIKIIYVKDKIVSIVVKG